jgi:ankyrin repeat protein
MKEFFDAVQAGDLERVRSLVEQDRSLLNAKAVNGSSPFVLAKYSGRTAVAEYLLGQGPELDIYESVLAGFGARVETLLQEQPGLVNSYSADGWTALHLAAFFRQNEVASLLIAHGADVHAQSRNAMRNTPLHAAASSRNLEVARMLLAHRADVNARQHGGWTALHAASLNGDTELGRLLLENGADRTARAENNQNSLDLALTKGHQAMVELLEQHGA